MARCPVMIDHDPPIPGLQQRPGRWALPPQPPETWVSNRASPLLVAGAAVAVAVPELILFPGAAPGQLALAVAYALGGLLALTCAYLLAIQASVAQDVRLAWVAGGFALLLLVDLARSLAAGDQAFDGGMSMAWLLVIPLVLLSVPLSTRGLPWLALPAFGVIGTGILATELPPTGAVTMAMGLLALGVAVWWWRTLPQDHREAWLWPGVTCALLPLVALERTLDDSALRAAIIEDLVLAVPAVGLALLSGRGYLKQSRRWRRLEEDVRSLRVSALLPGLSVTPPDVAGLPAAGEMATLIAEIEPQVALQPVQSLSTGATVGQEALSRFGGRVPTERWFRGAALHGLGAELERITLRVALSTLPRLPAGQFLAVNISPASLYDDTVLGLLRGTDLARLVIEVTEHDAIDDYEDTRRILAQLRARGARIAVDDVGAGFASLTHLLLLQPDMIKLDTSLTRDVHKSPKQQAMVQSLVAFADEVGSVVLAEGVEIAEQIPALLEAGVTLGQGWHLGVPVLST